MSKTTSFGLFAGWAPQAHSSHLLEGRHALRGGKLFKNDGGATANTPQGALAIRGGMFMGQITGPKSAIYSSTVSL